MENIARPVRNAMEKPAGIRCRDREQRESVIQQSAIMINGKKSEYRWIHWLKIVRSTLRYLFLERILSIRFLQVRLEQ